MAFEPLDWLDVAETLAIGDEAARRTAIGRYYYALFLKSRITLAQSGLLNVRGDDTDHRAVIAALRLNKRAAAGNALAQLRLLRNRADYDIAFEASSGDVQRARALGREIRRMCEPDWQRAST